MKNLFHVVMFQFRTWYLSCLFLGICTISIAQSTYLDSLLQILEIEKDEMELLRTYTRVGHFYQDNSDAKAIEFYKEALAISEQLDIPVRIANSHYNMAYSYLIKSDFDDALDHYLQSARVYEEIPDSFRLANALMSVANIYSENNDYPKTEEYHARAQTIVEGVRDTFLLSELLNSRGVLYDRQEKFEEALTYFQRAYDLAVSVNADDLVSYTLSNMALTYKRQGRSEKALEIFNQVLDIFEQSEYPPYVYASIHNNIGSTYAQMKQYSKAREAFDLSIQYAEQANAPGIIMEGHKKLAELYGNSRNFENQANSLTKYYSLKDSLFSIESKNTIVQLEADYQIEQKNFELLKQEAEITRQKSQRNIFLIISSSAVILLLALAFFYRRIRKSNALLKDKNTLINQQNDELEHTLNDLKSTQTQLIQSEKMASLGELTAGIAHEIQNPLNFVNNFSEVSGELLDEALEELTSTPLSKQRLDEAKDILGDLKQNLEKIHHHGGRADSIVKGMLQHSRTSSGEKEPTDINELADEYLRLAYHGLRAKDPTFNASFETNFDESIGKINVIPQDIGRVLLNLITNAFQAVHEKSSSLRADSPSGVGGEQGKSAGFPDDTREEKRVESASLPSSPYPKGMPSRDTVIIYDYQPKVTISTQRLNNSTTITIQDNGPGIPDSIKDKIFQPFFTTKPTGQGTGLGLSLSYDIIKAHGGEIQLQSQANEGTTFTITLPIS
ncbi:MAG: tetratricopeptide repeat protein [Bacteroidia bacterium]|nr:tetratricopeptide repeat protein [Bacteroidia bacterium]